MIECLGVPFEHVVEPLVLRQEIEQVAHDSDASLRVIGRRLERVVAGSVIIGDAGGAAEDLHRLLVRVLVQIAGDDHLGIRVRRKERVDEIVDGLSLAGALHLASIERGLVEPKQRCAAAF